MEILNKRLVVMLAAILLAFTMEAQDIKEIQKAFEDSYKLEKEAEYKKAADRLKEVYQENSLNRKHQEEKPGCLEEGFQ